MTDQPFVPVGRVVKTHGLKGEVLVASVAEAPLSLLEGIELWLVPPADRVRTIRLVSVRQGPKGALVTFSGIDSISQAASIVQRDLLARAGDVPQAWLDSSEEGFDPIGLTIMDGDRGLLGEVDEVIITGANDVWVVHGPLGEVLLPVIDDVILDVDEVAREVAVRLLPGLLPDDEVTE